MAFLKDTICGKKGGRWEDGKSLLFTKSQKVASFLKAFSDPLSRLVIEILVMVHIVSPAASAHLMHGVSTSLTP